jgi:tRNA(fMet)-specific endonuclease VapC
LTPPKLIVDTNILSYTMRGHELARLYVPRLEGKLLAISFITVGEMYYCAEKRQWGVQKRKQLETTLRNFVVVPYDHEIARCYGRLVAERERQGKPITCADAWIAACAVRHDVPLVTHNANHFENITNLQVITEYQRQ